MSQIEESACLTIYTMGQLVAGAGFFEPAKTDRSIDLQSIAVNHFAIPLYGADGRI